MANYFVCNQATGTNAGTSWVNAADSIPSLMTSQAIAGGDIIYVHNTHNYAAGASITWTLPESGAGLVQVLCVDGGDAAFTALGAAMGTTVGNLTTGAIESSNGNFSVTIAGVSGSTTGMYIHGVSLQSGAGGNSSGADITVGSLGAAITFSGCAFWINSTNAGALFSLGQTAGASSSAVLFDKCTFRFAATSQGITTMSGRWKFCGCSINASGSSPTTLFLSSTTTRAVVECCACDWTLATNVVDQSISSPITYRMWNCAINTPTTGTHNGIGGVISEFMACAPADGSNGADILSYYLQVGEGVVEDDQTAYLTSSPSQGTQDDGTATSYSLKMTPSTYCTKIFPLYTPWRPVKVAGTGSKTITVKVADMEGALLKDSELFLEVLAMHEPAATDTSRVVNSPHAQVDTNAPVVGSTLYRDVLAAGSNLTDTGEAWTGITETGTYTLSKTLTLDEQGYIMVRVGLAKDTTNPVSVDGVIGVA